MYGLVKLDIHVWFGETGHSCMVW